MKKAMLLSLVVIVLAGLIWVSASASGSSPSIEVSVYSKYLKDAKPGSQVQAGLYTAEENHERVSCVAAENPGHFLCQVPERFAGQELLIQLTENDIMHVGLVSIPAK